MRCTARTSLLLAALAWSAAPTLLLAQSGDAGRGKREQRTVADEMQRASGWLISVLDFRGSSGDAANEHATALAVMRGKAFEGRAPSATFADAIHRRVSHESTAGGVLETSLPGELAFHERARAETTHPVVWVSDHLAKSGGEVGAPGVTSEHPWVSDHVDGSSGGTNGSGSVDGSMNGGSSGSGSTSVTPEPATIVLMASGLLLVAIAAPRRRSRDARIG